jgi:hypothetical protein
MRLGVDPLTRARRRVAAYNLGAIAALLPVAAYQTGILRHLPEPPIGRLDADRVDASGEAYATLRTADSALGIASNAATVALATAGAANRSKRRPALTALFAAKVLADAAAAAALTVEQATKHRRFCGYCLIASTFSILAVPPALKEAFTVLSPSKGPS